MCLAEEQGYFPASNGDTEQQHCLSYQTEYIIGAGILSHSCLSAPGPHTVLGTRWMINIWFGGCCRFFLNDHIYYKSQFWSVAHPKYILYSWVELLPEHWNENRLIFWDSQQPLHIHTSKLSFKVPMWCICTKYQCQGLALYLLVNTLMRCLL